MSWRRKRSGDVRVRGVREFEACEIRRCERVRGIRDQETRDDKRVGRIGYKRD